MNLNESNDQGEERKKRDQGDQLAYSAEGPAGGAEELAVRQCGIPSATGHVLISYE